jgi:hypothetical protein
VTRALDRDNEHALMLGARSSDSLRDDASLFGDEALELLFRLIIDVVLFVVAEPASAFFPDLSARASL